MSLASKDAFKKLTEKDRSKVLEKVVPHLDRPSLDAKKSAILSYAPSFYPDCTLYEITDMTQVPPVLRVALFSNKNKEVTVLDWTQEPIYTLNKKLPIALDDQNITSYVRFFFQYIKGPRGKFKIAETVDDIKWKDDPAPAGRKAMAEMLEPLTLLEKSDGGEYKLSGCLLYRGSLFSADIYVSADGSVNVKNEAVLIENIPVMDDVLGQ